MKPTRVLATAVAALSLAAVAGLATVAAAPNSGQQQAGWGAWPTSSEHTVTTAAVHGDDSYWG
ncbi:hypothetical protein [Kitasatospora sp. NPDC101183]|uniref:hypothetical protein n=1 Tax=Kitasatospora sp. NPDC101183 TaxID=3364100 RepID=UPI003803A851